MEVKIEIEPLEVEVKLGVDDPRSILGLIERPEPSRLAGFEAAGPVQVREVVDRYLDTGPTGGSLAEAGYRARLRTERRRTTLTLKDEARHEGLLMERLELEGPATLRLDPATWPASLARDRLVALLAAPVPAAEPAPARGLRVVASLRQHRRARLLRSGPTLVEMSLDELEAPAFSRGRAAAPRRTELELELKSGERAALLELAETVRAIPGLRPAVGSKRDFALAARPRPGRPSDVTDSRVVNEVRTTG